MGPDPHPILWVVSNLVDYKGSFFHIFSDLNHEQ